MCHFRVVIYKGKEKGYFRWIIFKPTVLDGLGGLLCVLVNTLNVLCYFGVT